MTQKDNKSHNGLLDLDTKNKEEGEILFIREYTDVINDSYDIENNHVC